MEALLHLLKMLASFLHQCPPEIGALLSLEGLISTRTLFLNGCGRIGAQFSNGSVFPTATAFLIQGCAGWSFTPLLHFWIKERKA